ncbi:hypothetical protein Athai_00940 [Actinocatenispora thailandica]|uniref:Uncharacterized protein n=1 Tax=Actinocatenispora thailandica TaxID=227318 RepID=A0A7R7DJB0_9ACTN|nr:hypothetical protein [Actinocatenispora thailandica]BCJ32591.1 hypothetical protein Athai_00940 [Actinocatenispora thailandica]
MAALELVPPLAVLAFSIAVRGVEPATLPAHAVLAGLVGYCGWQLHRNRTRTQRWGRAGQLMAALLGVLVLGSPTVALVRPAHEPAWGPLVLVAIVAGGAGGWLLAGWLADRCVGWLLRADPADLAASPLAVSWPTTGKDRILVEPHALTLLHRQPSRHGRPARAVTVRTTPLAQVAPSTVTVRVVDQPGGAGPEPMVQVGAGPEPWLLPAREPERLARLIALRATANRPRATATRTEG